MKSKAVLVGVVVGVAGLAFVGGCELIASVNHDDINEASSAASTTGVGGSSSASTTVASTTVSVSSSNSSSAEASSSSTGGCMGPGECMQPTAQCEEATCDAMVCGVADKMMLSACTENGGKVCDGAGTCVECLSNTECTNVGEPVCDTTAHVCVNSQCADSMQNGNETDVNCGGGTCGDCAVGKKCLVASDCLSGFCPSGPKLCTACSGDGDCGANEWCDSTINAGTCVAKITDGNNCTADNQCTNGHCFGTGLQICCNTECDGVCESCLAAEKASGAGQGSCGPVLNNSDPYDSCPTSGSNDCQRSVCDGAGACGIQSSTTLCGEADVCMNSQFTVQQNCDGTSLTCPAPVGLMPCPGGHSCLDVNSCGTACTATAGAPPNGVQTGCAPTFYCSTPGSPGTCSARLGSGQTCTQNFECLSNTCNCPGGDCSVSSGTCQ